MLCIKKVRVFAPEDKGICDIVIANDRIVDIAPGLGVFLPKDAVMVDGRGKIAVPGFIDQHVHITGGGGESGFASKIRGNHHDGLPEKRSNYSGGPFGDGFPVQKRGKSGFQGKGAEAGGHERMVPDRRI